MQYHAPSNCPVCGSTMQLTRLHCDKCNTELSGSFEPCRFCRLEEKHMHFVETFLRCRGSIKEMEKALGVSYPTVRNMMDAALAALGLDDRDGAAQSKQDSERERIIDKLARKEVTVEEATALLRELKDEDEK